MIKILSVFAIIYVFLLTGFYSTSNYRLLFDGKTFDEWQGDTLNKWHIEKGSLVGGCIDKTVTQNNFLCTKRSYANFIRN